MHTSILYSDTSATKYDYYFSIVYRIVYYYCTQTLFFISFIPENVSQARKSTKLIFQYKNKLYDMKNLNCTCTPNFVSMKLKSSLRRNCPPQVSHGLILNSNFQLLDFFPFLTSNKSEIFFR